MASGCQSHANTTPVNGHPDSHLAILLLLGINRKIATGQFTVSTSLTLPVLLLLIPSLVSLYAAVDLRQSWSAVCRFIAGIVLNSLGVEGLLDLAGRPLVWNAIWRAGRSCGSGCFDMLHSGHIAFFKAAAKYVILVADEPIEHSVRVVVRRERD